MSNLSLSDDFEDISISKTTNEINQENEEEENADKKSKKSEKSENDSFSSFLSVPDTQNGSKDQKDKEESTIKTTNSKNQPPNAKENEEDDFESLSDDFESQSNNSKITYKPSKSNKGNNTPKSTKSNKEQKTENSKKTGKSENSTLREEKKVRTSKDSKKKSDSDDEPVKENKEKIVNSEQEKISDYKPPKIRPIAPKPTEKSNDDLKAEIERLQNIVVSQRSIIDSQKQTIKLLMKEQINYEEMSKLRAALASKDPLLQLVAATPLSETRLTQDLRAENASLRREIDEIENRHLAEMKALRSQYAQLSARKMPEDGCAACRRRIRELESQLKSNQ